MEADGTQLTDDPIGDGADAWPFFAARCAAAGVEVAARVIPGWSATSTNRRSQESAAARELARELLRPHGFDAPPLPRHALGFPRWPQGWVGSIAHSAGWCAVAQSTRSRALSVGVDVEAPTRMQHAMWPHLMTGAEMDAVLSQPEPARAVAATAIFCAKEALFKTLFPLDQRVPGFLDLEVEWTGRGAFRARPIATATTAGFALETAQGRVTTRAGIVLAAAWVPAD